MFKRRAVFLDRDGTVIDAVERPDFAKKLTAPFSFEELAFVPGVLEALEELRQMDFLRILITNQPDVAHGYISEPEWEKIHTVVTRTLRLDDVFMCRHRTEDGCPFKKPSPLMILAAADKWGIDLLRSYMIGDTEKDTKAGFAAGVKTVLVERPYNMGISATFVVPNLLNAVSVIRGSVEKNRAR